MNVIDASKVLHMNPQSLRLHLQRGDMPQIGFAYKNLKGTGWGYKIYETEVLKIKGRETHESN